MNGIGENKLIAYLAGLATLITTAWLVPDALAAVTTAVIALFGLLLNKKKEE
jgi:hypothetical protein